MCAVYLYVVFLCCIKIPLLSATASYKMRLADSWSDYKDESVFLSFKTRNDELPYNLLAYISKPSECKQVEFYAAIFPPFSIYPVSMNDLAE